MTKEMRGFAELILVTNLPDGFTCEPVLAVWIACNTCGEAELLSEDTPEKRQAWAQNHLRECDPYFDIGV